MTDRPVGGGNFFWVSDFWVSVIKLPPTEKVLENDSQLLWSHAITKLNDIYKT